MPFRSFKKNQYFLSVKKKYINTNIRQKNIRKRLKQTIYLFYFQIVK
jgi:hypothetical protein